MVKPEEVPNLNDDELMKILKQAGLNKGPLTSTTRSIYEKKLIKFLKESKLPEENLAPSKTPSKTTKPVEKPRPTEPLKESNKNETLNFSPRPTPEPKSVRPNSENVQQKISINRNVQEHQQPTPTRQVQQEQTYTHDMTNKRSEPIRESTVNRKTDPIPFRQPQEETRYSSYSSSQKTDPIQIRSTQEPTFNRRTDSGRQQQEESRSSSLSHSSREPTYGHKTDSIQVRQNQQEEQRYSSQKSDSIQIRPAQESRVMYASNSTSVPKQSSIFAPPLNMQRERNHSKDSFETRSRSSSIFDKYEKSAKESQSTSSKTSNSTLPLQFKLINKEDEAKSKVSEERPFLGYIKTDRQVEQKNYLINRRSIMKLDQGSSLREQNKSPELYSKPIIDLSPRLDRTFEKREQPQVTSSITITKIDKTNNSEWLKNNLKYLLSVFVVTIIVFYFLQSSEEDNPLFE